MLISEIFYSIQGEGTLTGMPSVFVRTAGCNLRCAWCDTPYASWQPEGKPLTIDDIVAEVIRHPTQHVVLTGGEPMAAPGIADLASELKLLGRHVTIETAATIAPYCAGSTTTATLGWFFAAARTIEGPPMSICSTHSSVVAPDATVAANG